MEYRVQISIATIPSNIYWVEYLLYIYHWIMLEIIKYKSEKKWKKPITEFVCDKCWCIYESDEYVDDEVRYFYCNKCPVCKKENIILY
jgi:hypothetical protein